MNLKMANKILLHLNLMIAATVVNGQNYNIYRSRVVKSSSRIGPGFTQFSSPLLPPGSPLPLPNAQLSPSQCKSYSRQGPQYTWCHNFPQSHYSQYDLTYDRFPPYASQPPSYDAQLPYSNSQLPSYHSQSPSYNPLLPSYHSQSSSYDPQLPSYHLQSPSYDAQLPSYHSQSPSYDPELPPNEGQLTPYNSQSPSYDPQSPSYEDQLPSHSQSPSYDLQFPFYEGQLISSHSQSPSYEPQLPSYEGQLPSYNSNPPSYDPQLPSHEDQLPSYHSQSPSYDAQLPSHNAQLPSYDAQLPSYDVQLPSYDAQLPSYPSQSPSYDAQLPSYHSQPPSYDAQLPSHDSQPSSSGDQLPSYDSRPLTYYDPQYSSPQHSQYSPEYGSQYTNGLYTLPDPYSPNYESQYPHHRPYGPPSVSHHHHHQHSHGARPHNYNHKYKYPMEHFNNDQDYGEEHYKYDSGKKQSISDSYNKYENSGLQINNVAAYPSGSRLQIKSLSYPPYQSRSNTPLALVIAMPRRAKDKSRTVARGGRVNIREVLANFRIDHQDYRGDADLIDVVRGAILDGLNLDFMDIEQDHNYLSLIYAVHRLAYNEQCADRDSNLLVSNFGPRRYYEIVTQVLRDVQNETVLEKMFDEIFMRTIDGAADIWNIIVNANSTNPICETDPDECNQYIRGIIRASPDREKLLSQGKILRYAAAFAKYYFENYHDQFMKAASIDGGNVQYFKDSQEDLMDLAIQLMKYKIDVGKDCTYQISTESSTSNNQFKK